MKSIDSDSLNELLASARTPDEIAAIEDLINEAASEPQPVEQKWVAASLGEVAEFFGLNVQTVKQWRTESPPMPGTEAGWPLKEIVAWRHAKLAQSDLVMAKRAQDIELGAIQLEQKRLDLDREKGELLDRTDVELWASTALIEAREMVMSLPERLATSSPPEIRDYVREESDRHCRDVLTALRRRLEESAITQEEPE